MGNLFISNIHFLIFAWIVYDNYTLYENYTTKIKEINDELPGINRKITRYNKEHKQLTAYYDDIEEAKTRIEKVAQEVEKLQRQLPNKIDDTENLQLIDDITRSVNLKDVDLKPQGTDNKGFYLTKNYKLKASGTYLQFLIFFEKIANTSRLFNIKNVKLHSTDIKQKGRFQVIGGDIILFAYQYNTSYREKRGIEEIEKQFKKRQKTGRKSKRKRKGKGKK
ncbi:MAG: type 4a pilus biogenesis protein PilO [Bacteriovoracaceae bacterium]|nr:type 4a pilus biogenesis protein PilO [Bacteriovoracaceae bacterium]